MTSFITDDIAYSNVRAVDEDDDTLIYTIESEYFTIHPTTAVVRVSRPLTDSTDGTCCVIGH